MRPHVHKELSDGMDIAEVDDLLVGDGHQRKIAFKGR